jgi:SAM-dependent methyltransferase
MEETLMSWNWIKPEDYSLNCFLFFERFQIGRMMDLDEWKKDNTEWRHNIGVALNANPAVKWYFAHKCPKCADALNEITMNAPAVTDAAEIRKAEIYALLSVEDFTIYTRPESMDANCDFIRGWDKQRLFDLADFFGKVVLDVGSGSGRLAFAAAERAAWVYASEPVDTMREYLRDKITRENIKNMRVLDCMAHAIPYPDDFFDIVMSGHVIGDDYDGEIAEMTRVCKSGGWLIDCPGDSERDIKLNEEEVKRGFEPIHYKGSFGCDVHCYRKQIWKG